ncbi:hypothetical protein A3K63_04920 [Candidatus Micrarchaeota archaeon RBG_16_49_10]|nr:MAG: hypothetical protein A3K63_04920 [Candidatus Micrarchaeota archaeon RBG_16_49_10]
MSDELALITVLGIGAVLTTYNVKIFNYRSCWENSQDSEIKRRVKTYTALPFPADCAYYWAAIFIDKITRLETGI